MDYFNELLESYDKLKKRKLEIIVPIQEQESADPAELLALQHVKSAVGLDKANAIQVQTPRSGPVSIWTAATTGYIVAEGPGLAGQNTKRLADVNGNPLGGTWWKKFVGMLRSEEEEEAEADGGRGQEAAGSYVPQAIATTETTRGFQKLRRLAPTVFNILGGKKALGRSLGYWANYIAGSRYSLEVNFSRAQTVSFGPDGKPVFTDVDPRDMEGAIQSAVNLMELLDKTEWSENDKRLLRDSVAMGDDGSVFFFVPGDKGRGLVLKDPHSVYGTMVERAHELMGVDLDRVDTLELSSRHGDSAMRGLGLEHIRPALQAAYFCQKGKELGLSRARAEAYCREATRLYALTARNSSRAMVAHSWAFEHAQGERAVTMEAKPYIDAFTELAGDLRTVIQGIAQVASQSIEVRRPMANVQVGGQKGIGLKSDNLEISQVDENGECSHAVDGLLRSGFSSKEISQNNMVRQMPAAEAFAQDPDQMEFHRGDEGIFSNDDDPVCVNAVGLKSPLNFRTAKMGELYDTRVSEFLSGALDEADPRYPAFREHIRESLGIDDSGWESIQKYEEGLQGYRDAVMALNPTSNVIDPETGDTSRGSSLESFAKMYVNHARTNLDYDDVTEDELAKAFDRKGLDPRDPDDAEILKHLATRFLIEKKREKDIERERGAGNPRGPASLNLAATMYTVGGVLDKGELVEVDSLRERDALIFRHDEAFEVAVGGFLSGEWDYSKPPNKTGDPGLTHKLSRGDSELVLRAEREGRHPPKTRYTCSVNRAFAGELRKNPRQESVPELSHNVIELLKNQQSLLETILKGLPKTSTHF